MIHPTVWAKTAIREFVAKAFDEEVLVEADAASHGPFFGRQIGMAPSRRIHLTFDDGPHPINTPRLLDDLKQFGVLATFFVKGKNLESPQGRMLLERIAWEGHQIGNHTYSHRHLTELTEQEIRNEILKTETLIGNADGGIKVFRPPFGDHDSRVDQIVEELGYRLVLWNVDTFDWDPKCQNRWVRDSMARIVKRKDSLVLAHDSIAATVNQARRLMVNIRELSDSRLIDPSEAFSR
jgi:peptidoglycan-N-acetylglucosamine deacetylase